MNFSKAVSFPSGILRALELGFDDVSFVDGEDDDWSDLSTLVVFLLNERTRRETPEVIVDSCFSEEAIAAERWVFEVKIRFG